MPTQTDFQELLSGTTNEWITNYNGTGVNGRKFTSKTNGNSIFFPAAGCRSGSWFSDQGDYGLVWSSSLNTSHPTYAWSLDFNLDDCSMDDHNYYYGIFVVRGVME